MSGGGGRSENVVENSGESRCKFLRRSLTSTALSEVQNITFKYLPSGESLVYEHRSSHPMGQAYRVVSPFIAIQSTADGYKTITLLVGCEIRICGAAQKFGLVDVDLAGKIV